MKPRCGDIGGSEQCGVRNSLCQLFHDRGFPVYSNWMNFLKVSRKVINGELDLDYLWRSKLG